MGSRGTEEKKIQMLVEYDAETSAKVKEANEKARVLYEARVKKEKEDAAVATQKAKEEDKKREEAAIKARELNIKSLAAVREKAVSIPSPITISRNESDVTTNQLVKRAPDSVLAAKLNNPALLAPDRVRFKNAFGSMIKLPKDDFITGKFIAAVLSGSLKLLIFEGESAKFFAPKDTIEYKGHLITNDERPMYGEYTIPSGFNIQWIHNLLANTNKLVGYLLSINNPCYDFSYYMWIAMTMEPNIYIHMEYISRIFERYATFSAATLGEKRQDSIRADLWAIYEGAQGSATIQKKVKKLGDLKGAGSIVSGSQIKTMELFTEGEAEIKTSYRRINKLLIASFMYGRLKSSTKSLLIQVLTAISFHRELPERYGKIVDGENFSLFELVKKSSLTEKLYEASFDIVSCMPIETKMLFMVDIVFKRLLCRV